MTISFLKFFVQFYNLKMNDLNIIKDVQIIKMSSYKLVIINTSCIVIGFDIPCFCIFFPGVLPRGLGCPQIRRTHTEQP